MHNLLVYLQDREGYNLRNIYLVQTKTGTLASRIINLFLREEYVHLSISLDSDLNQMYSFGQVQSINPFVGGFQREDFTETALSLSSCKIHKVPVSKDTYKQITKRLESLENNSDNYHYNVLGLITAYFRIPWDRTYAFFCSEYISKLLTDTNVVKHQIPHSTIRPEELITEIQDKTVVYEGTIKEYKGLDTEEAHPLATLFNR